jgi:hypothetical protein
MRAALVNDREREMLTWVARGKTSSERIAPRAWRRFALGLRFAQRREFEDTRGARRLTAPARQRCKAPYRRQSHNEQSGNNEQGSAQLFRCVEQRSSSRLAEPTLSNRIDARVPLPGLPGARVKSAGTIGRLIALNGHNRAG